MGSSSLNQDTSGLGIPTIWQVRRTGKATWTRLSRSLMVNWGAMLFTLSRRDRANRLLYGERITLWSEVPNPLYQNNFSFHIQAFSLYGTKDNRCHTTHSKLCYIFQGKYHHTLWCWLYLRGYRLQKKLPRIKRSKCKCCKAQLWYTIMSTYWWNSGPQGQSNHGLVWAWCRMWHGLLGSPPPAHIFLHPPTECRQSSSSPAWMEVRS